MPRVCAAEKGPERPPAAGPLDSRSSGCPRVRGPHLADVLRSAVVMGSQAGSVSAGSAFGSPPAPFLGGFELLLQPAVHRDGREVADLVLRERQRDRVRVDPSNRAHRDRHFPLAPQMASFENEVGDGVLAVDEEPVDMANVVAIG